jgi:ureidoacrylate peracid hydrolase
MNVEALKEKARPEQTAVVIIDMQKDYCCEGGAFHRRGFDVVPAQELVPRLNGFLDHARQVLKHIVHLKMTKVAELSCDVGAELYRRLGIERRYDPSFADFFGVVPHEGDVVIPKYKYSGFVSTYLDQYLRANGVRTLIITGIATNVCVESTARDSFMRDYFTLVPSDLTEGTSVEAKQWSLANINMFFGEVVDSESLLRCWGLKGP